MDTSLNLIRYIESGTLSTFNVIELEYFIEGPDDEGWLARSYEIQSHEIDVNCDRLKPEGGTKVPVDDLYNLFRMIEASSISLAPQFSWGKDGMCHRLDLGYEGFTGLTIKWWSDCISEKSIIEIRNGLVEVIRKAGCEVLAER